MGKTQATAIHPIVPQTLTFGIYTSEKPSEMYAMARPVLDQLERGLAAEWIREQLLALTREELPAVAVQWTPRGATVAVEIRQDPGNIFELPLHRILFHIRVAIAVGVCILCHQAYNLYY